MTRILLAIILTVYFIPTAKGEEPATFVIDSPRFSSFQSNDYRIGNFDRTLTEAELLQIVKNKSYQLTHQVFVEFNRYLYFVYIVDNKTPHPVEAFMNYPMWFAETQTWIVDGDRLLKWNDFPKWGNIQYFMIPPGRHYMVGMRLSRATMKSQATTVQIADFSSLASYWKVSDHLQSALFGAVGVMILYNIAMLLVYRRIYFLYYSLYSSSALYTIAMSSGYIVNNLRYMGTAVALAALFVIQFCNSSLSLRRGHPSLYKASHVLSLASLLLGVFSWLTGDWLGLMINLPLVMGFCFLTSVMSWRAGYRPAAYLVLGWGCFFAAVSLTLINIAFFGSRVMAFSSVIGFAIEICLFSFAIGQKVRLSEQKALQSSDHAFSQLKKVFYPHQITKIKAGDHLENTMPVGVGHACVICFDIIDSSKIRSDLVKKFLEDSIKSCVSILSENYREDGPVANGYRIKEMGDGFLCSVGYPFRSIAGRDPAVTAVEIALRIVEAFQRQVDLLNDHQPIYCSMALAVGELEAHFPQIGVMEYDVHGYAIELAQRYESLRKKLFPQGVPGHIITLHSAVFEALSLDLRQGFVEIELQVGKYFVRDDPLVKSLYYRLMSADEVIPLKTHVS